jgi:AraC-like DNA-binding protein
MPHWSLPRAAASAQLMIGLAREYGVSFKRCVVGTQLTSEVLADPAREIDGQQELGVLRNILRALDPSVPFALQAGQRYHLTTHGMWGLTIMSSPDLRSAVDLSLRYFDLSYSFNRMSFEIRGEHARFIFDASDNPDDLRAALIERDLAAFVTMGRDFAAFQNPIVSMQLRSRRPAYAAAFESLFGVMPQFNAALNCATIAAAFLENKPPLADALGVRVGEEQCQALLERRMQRSGVAGRVYRRLLSKPGEFPSMKSVAEALGISTRTLRNQLSRESTSFRKLVEELREALAEQLLATHTSIDQIAQRLGYADASAFISAFKRWKGVAPGGYRTEREGK